MAIKAYLYNGGAASVQLEPRNGLVYRDELNETLDSATIVVRSRQSIDAEPFDYVTISGSVRGNAIEAKSMCVDSVDEEQTSFGDDHSYDTTITLFSETKELERVTLPNLSITSKPNGTARSVYDYIEEYVAYFAPRIKARVNDSYSLEPMWQISPYVRTRFSSVECPEFSWNRPTLREVLTDLMQVEDCIPVVKGHVLSFIDLRKRYGEADDSDFVRVVRGISSHGYNQNLDVNMQNAISTKPAHLTEFVSMRNESSGILTTDNMQVITLKPIYEIKKVSAVFMRETTVGGQRKFNFTEADITDSIKEKMAYDVLNPTPVEFSASNPFSERQQTHQVANVWFARGGRSIEGFGKGFEFYNRTELAIHYILRGALTDYDEFTSALNSVDYRDVMFKVEYMSQGEMAVKVGRNLPLRNSHNSAFDNQGSSYVDARQQSLFEYAKANRLANKIIEINGTCYGDGGVPSLGQTYKGAVIFSREIQYFDDLVSFHLYAAENYVLTNYFTAIKAKRRSWAIASGKEALTRHENMKMYAEFSRTSRMDSTESQTKSMYFSSGNPETVLSFLYHFYNDETVKTAALFTVDSAEARRPEKETVLQQTFFAVDCQTSATGLSISMSVELQDNYSAGENVTIDSNGRYVNNILPYADSDGEFSQFEVRFLSYQDPADGDFVWGGYYFHDYSTPRQIRKGWPEYSDDVGDDEFKYERVAKGRKKPVMTNVGNSEAKFSVSASMLKDNREIFALTAQIEYCSDEPGIIVKKRVVDRSCLISGEQESYANLPVLASGLIKTPSSIPSASSAYQYVGFLYRDSQTFGDLALRYAKAVSSGSGWDWQFEAIAANQKFAIMEGYEEDQPDASSANRYVMSSRVIVVKMNDVGTNFVRFEKDFMIFTMADSRISESEDTVPASATVMNDVSLVSITMHRYNSMRIQYADGANKACWGLCDADGYVLFAVNAPETGDNASSVYVNLSSTRDHAIRLSVAEQHIVVGEV